QLARADPKRPETYRPAIDAFRRAAERAGQRAAGNPPDPRARGRRGEALADLAEASQHARQYRDAVATYNTILQEKLAPSREQQPPAGWRRPNPPDAHPPEPHRACPLPLAPSKPPPLPPPPLPGRADPPAWRALGGEKPPTPAPRPRGAPRHNDEAVKRYAA